MNSEGDDEGVSATAETPSGVPTEVAPVDPPVMRSTLVGAEMLNWSDLEPVDVPPALGGPAAAALLDAAVPDSARVLLAGPHALDLVAPLAGRVAALDVLVRSTSDAETIAERHDGSRVFNGGLDRFTIAFGEPAYDVVVALDGIDRLVGPDSPELTWGDALAALQARVTPGGRLLLGAANTFGIDRIVTVPGLPGDDAWPREVATAAPAGEAAVRAAVEQTGWTIDTQYAVWPDRFTPGLALSEVAGPVAGTLVARALARRVTGETLTDPYRSARDAVDAGLGTALAPGWFLVTGPAGRTPAGLPAVLGGVVPDAAGDLVEERLLTAARFDDQLEIRRVLGSYAGWLRGLDGPAAAGSAADQVLTDGTSYKPFPDGATPSGDATGTVTGDALVVRNLARFARRWLTAGVRQPWEVAEDHRKLTTHLAAMVAITVDDAGWAAAVDGTGDDRPAAPQGRDALLVTIARLNQELADASTQATWYEGQLDRLRKSRSYRIGVAVTNPLRAAYRNLRSRVR